MAKPNKPAAPDIEAKNYKHPEAESPMRPEVGTQANFRKKKAPVTYKYDSSLSPELSWNDRNPAREQGEALIKRILEAGTVEEAQAAARWINAVNADGSYGIWKFAMARCGDGSIRQYDCFKNGRQPTTNRKRRTTLWQ